MGDVLVRELEAVSGDAMQFGGKAAGLSRLISLGHRVPAGFAVAVDAMTSAIGEIGLAARFDALDDSMRRGEPDASAAGEIHDALMRGDASARLMERLRQSVEALGDGRLIVRSSAVSEDSAAHSYAGIFESIPVESERMADGIAAVWASAFTPRALAYAVHAGLGTVPRMGVIVQRFIDAERSGVMFTSFPRPGGGQDTLVEHVAGTAEKLVRGEVTPSRLWLRSTDGDDVDLGASAARELVRLAKELEAQFGGPQDVEWCLSDAEIHVVQTRPVTAGFVGGNDAVPEDHDVLLRGTPASPGVGSGAVHLAFNVDQALALPSGAVLVTPMTNPDMVVAMRNSAAIVTDVGGMICHAAIVSRELQLPCVVGTGDATETLDRGAVITVDGGRGVVVAGVVAPSKTSGTPMTAANLWELWRGTSPDLVPLVSTRELVATAPPQIDRLAYVIDNDLRCGEGGLWQAWADSGARAERLGDVLAGVATAADLAGTIVHIVTLGAVSADDIAEEVSRLGDARLRPPGEIDVAWTGPSERFDRPLAVPLAGCAARSTRGRAALGAVQDSIARSLDPANGPGPAPAVVPAPMPARGRREAWWDRLAEYGRFHREFTTADDNEDVHPWIEIRPEVLTSPLLKSLVLPGFEMVPRCLEFAETVPMHTKWVKCRFHVRADSFAVTWGRLVQVTWDPTALEHLLRMVRRSYDDLAEIVGLFPDSDAAAREQDDAQLIALVTAWWPRWTEFFALCLFIQAQGEAILYPVIAETVEANLADLGPPSGFSWPAVADLVAPTTAVMSGEYMVSLGSVREQLDALGLTDVREACEALAGGASDGLTSAVRDHLDAWHWMRDRDLLFEPWDTAERVIDIALRTDPHQPVPYAENLQRNRLALALHADLAEAFGRGDVLRHGVRFLQDLNIERENHHVLWLKHSYPLRRIVREMERRLIEAGSPMDPGTVFYLQMPELLDGVRSLPDPLDTALCELAAERQRAYRHEAQLEPVDVTTLYSEDDYY
jgi:phosphohistidine swiveling domain-containing protein